MEVGWVVGQPWDKHWRGVVETGDERLLRACRSSGRFRVTFGDLRGPVGAVPLYEIGGVLRAEDIANGSASVIEHERELWLQEHVRSRIDIREEIFGRELARCVLAIVTSLYANLVNGFTVSGVITANAGHDAVF